MFSGIVQDTAPIISLADCRLCIQMAPSLLLDLKIGSSVSVDGVCLTVSKIEGTLVFFHLLKETLCKTTLGSFEQVNIERSLKLGDEIGGHLLSGHVFGTAILTAREGEVFCFGCDSEFCKYLFPKGYLAIDGASLTVVKAGPAHFEVHLIPETLSRTTLGTKKIGDRVNVEFDSQTVTIVDTLQRHAILA